MHNWRRAAYASVVLLSLLILATVCPISFSSNDSAEGATKNPSPSSLTFTSTSSTTSASLDVTSTSGNSATSSTNASFSLSTNNATGYTVNIKVDTDGYSTLKKIDDNTKTINSITSSSTLANLPVNTWGLLPSKYNGTNNTTTYYPASSAGFTMDTTSSANTVANSYTIGLGLKADYNTPAGAYTNTTIVAEYVANPITYAIYYYANTTDTVTGMPSPNPQVPVSAFPGTTSTTVSLASAPTRTGYTFLGWCLGTSSSSNITVGTNGNADTCASSSTNQFTAGQNFGINATGSSPDLYYFYAMWQANTYTVTISNSNTTSSSASITVLYGNSNTVTVTPASGYYLDSVSCPSGYTCTGYNTGESYTSAQTVTITNNNTASGGTLTFTGEKPKVYMQDLNSSTIAALLPSVGSTATVYDSRDENPYTIAKLADNKYWMVSNLNLAGGTALDADKTDVDSSYISSFTTSNNLTKTGSTIVLPASSTSGFNTNNYSYVYNSGNITTSQSDCTSSNPCNSYYSWDAATLGSGRSISTDNANAPYSICPKGWKLPTTYNGTNSTTDFRALMIALGGSNSVQTYNSSTTPTGATMYGELTASPYNFLLAGFYYNGSFLIGGSYGRYWSATSGSSSTYARSLYFYSTDVYSAGNYYRYYGFSVRCVFDNTMQSATSASLAAAMPNVGDTTTLRDVRDDQEYSIAKIGSLYWMTQNLMLGSSSAVTLYKATTNITADTYTLPARGTYGTSYSGQYVWGNDTQCTSSSTTACAGYYSYAAATAGTNPSSGTASSDICPAGWRLPTQAELTTLKNSYSTGSALTGSPFLGVYAGYYNSSFSSGSGGSYGYYWSSTALNSNYAYRLYFYSNSAYVDYNVKYYGYSVRCVAKS